MLTITSISTGLTSLIFLLCGVHLYFSWKKKKEDILLRVFMVLLLSIGFQQMFFSLGSGLFVRDVLASNVSWWMAHIFMFLGLGYFVRFPLRVKFPEKERMILKIVIIYSVIGATILLFHVPQIVPLFMENAVFNWQVPALAGATIGIFSTLIALFSLYVFLSETCKVETKILKFRSLFLALGIFVYYVGGPVHNFVMTPLMMFVACSLLVFGALIMMLGIYLPKIFKYLQVKTR